MECTSAEAGKMMRKLLEEKSSIEMRENNGKEFLAAVGEDLESVRPEYDFAKRKARLQKWKGRSENSNMRSTCSIPQQLSPNLI